MKAPHSDSMVPPADTKGLEAGRRRRLLALVLGVALALGVLAGCGRPKSEPAPAPEQEAKLSIFAAASLREAFGKMAEEFKKSHTSVTVTFNFAGSQEIRTQLEQGAVVDVFAAADMRNMTALREAGRVEAPTVFAENEPVVVVDFFGASHYAQHTD